MKLSNKTKKQLAIFYFTAGLTWCAINLPNLLESAEFKRWKAILIGAWRVIGWPVGFGQWCVTAYKKLKSDKKKKADEAEKSDEN